MARSNYVLSIAVLLGLGCGDSDAGSSPGTTTTDDPGSSSSSGTTGAVIPTASASVSASGPMGATDANASTSTGPGAQTTTTTDGPLTTGPVIPPGTESETSATEFDCLDTPDEPLGWQVIDGARGYHGIVIVPDGRIIGSDGSGLITSTYLGATGLLVPGLGSGQQIDLLADGDLVFSTDDAALTRVRLDGTVEIILNSVGAYGVVVGPDDMIYAVRDGENNGVVRVNPDTGVETQLFFASPGGHSMGFSPDWSRMYMATVGDGQRVYYADLDKNLNPVTEMQVLTDQVGEGSNWHDAVAVDTCGNLYVPDFWSSNIYRITPMGETSVYWTPASQNFYGHALIWGTGENGWRADALYMPNPYNSNTVSELIIGVPGRAFEGDVLNAPPMK